MSTNPPRLEVAEVSERPDAERSLGRQPQTEQEEQKQTRSERVEWVNNGGAWAVASRGGAPNEKESTLEIEPASMKSSGRCACCGKTRRTVWGYVYRDGGPRACYFVEWTLGRRDCSARFDVVVGDWFDGTTEDDRSAVSFEYRLLDTGPSFSLADAEGRPAAEVGRAKNIQITGTPLAEEAIAIAGAILEVDDRVRELVQ